MQQQPGAHDDAQEAGWTHDEKLANRKSRELEAKSRGEKNDVDQASRSTNEQSRLAHGGSSGVISSGLVELFDCSAGGDQRRKTKKKDGDVMEAVDVDLTNQGTHPGRHGMAWQQKDKVPTMENAYVGPPGYEWRPCSGFRRRLGRA
jgi:hypothetical protein